MTVHELAGRMQTVDINALVEQAIINNEQVLTDLNREQMRQGKTASDTAIVPDLRNKAYADAKKQAGGKAPFGTPDLYLTGSFQKEMQMEVDSRSYSFFSTDDKATKLNQKYADIFGLTPKNKERAKAINTARLGKLYKEAIGL